MTRTPQLPIRRLIFRWLSLSLFAGLALPIAPAHADAPTHEIRKSEPKVAAGGQASAGLTIAAKNGWHVNPEAPITVSLTSGDPALTLGKSKLGRADLAESTQETARFAIPVTCAPGTAAGTRTINAEARFVMCQETACKPIKETLSLNVEVTLAAAEAPTKAKASKGKAKSKTQ
jgi:DsbC/DsbD-like thiol-disulfide interchange protein